VHELFWLALAQPVGERIDGSMAWGGAVSNRIVWIAGGGGVAGSFVPLLLRSGLVEARKVRLVSTSGSGLDLARKYAQLSVEQNACSPDWLWRKLSPGDTFVNLAGGPNGRSGLIGCSLSTAQMCRNRGAAYLDVDRSNIDLATQYQTVRRAAKSPDWSSAPTALLMHGANPGLVSHFVKACLLGIRQQHVESKPWMDLDDHVPRTPSGWARLAQRLSVDSVQIVQRDTQTTAVNLRPGKELVSTWSPAGQWCEASARPARLLRPQPSNPERGDKPAFVEDLAAPTVSLWRGNGAAWTVGSWGEGTAWGWEPCGHSFVGASMAHPSLLPIGELLSVQVGTTQEGHRAFSYRPAVEFVHRPCPPTTRFLSAVKHRLQTAAEDDTRSTNMHRTMGPMSVPPVVKRLGGTALQNDAGYSSIGVVLTTRHAAGSGGIVSRSYWYGHSLTVRGTRQVLGREDFECANANATVFQAAAGALAGLEWLFAHPCRGLVTPETLNHRPILDSAAKYLQSPFTFSPIPPQPSNA
jgi:homospermidine synthase